jgi:hypothetical protein
MEDGVAIRGFLAADGESGTLLDLVAEEQAS